METTLTLGDLLWLSLAWLVVMGVAAPIIGRFIRVGRGPED